MTIVYKHNTAKFSSMVQFSDTTIADKEFRNWIKGALAVEFAKKGITDFVHKHLTGFHEDLLEKVYKQTGLPTGTICTSCTTANLVLCPTNGFCKGKICDMHDITNPVMNPNQPCPKGLCTAIRDEIRRQHRYGEPWWRSTDAQKWYTDAFEVAKCYMPPDGYFDTTSLQKTEYSKILSIIINNNAFQGKMAAWLDVQPNICTKARVVGREVRHSPDLRLSDFALAKYIAILRDLLQDGGCLCHDKRAQEAVNKLNQLQNNTLLVSWDDITKLLDDHVRTIITKGQQEALDAIRDLLNKEQTVVIDAFDTVMAVRDETLDSIQKNVDKEIKQIARPAKEDEELYKDLQTKLISLYKANESMISVSSPEDDSKDVSLVGFYVQPAMLTYRKSHKFTAHEREKENDKGNCGQEKTPITSYKRLFFNDDCKTLKTIYVEADAGMGKTSFAQKLAITWCHAHKPDQSQSLKLAAEEIDTMKHYDFFFPIHLRECTDNKKHIIEILPKKSQYSREFLERLLYNKNVLVALDEWSHPGSCFTKPEVPHNFPVNCSTIPATRRWKLYAIGLRPDNDRYVELSKLDLKSSEKLSSLENLSRLHLLFVAVNDIRVNSTSTEFDITAVRLGHNGLKNFFLGNGACTKLKGPILDYIVCTTCMCTSKYKPLTHAVIGNVCKDSEEQLPESTPLSLVLGKYCHEFPLDVTCLSSLQMLTIRSVPLQELYIPAGDLQQVHVENVSVTHTSVQNVFSNLREQLAVYSLYLDSVDCSDHRRTCPGFTLDMSHLRSLQILTLKSVPIQGLHIPAGCLQQFHIENVFMTHSALENVFNTGKQSQIKKLYIALIQCSEHATECPGFQLNITSLDNLQMLTLRSVPIKELHISASRMQELHIEKASMTHTAIENIFDNIEKHSSINILELCLLTCSDHAEKCPGFDLDISNFSRLDILKLNSIWIKLLHMPPQSLLRFETRNLHLSETAL